MSGWKKLSVDDFKAGLSPKARASFEAAEERIRQRKAAGLPAVPPEDVCSKCKGAGVVYVRPWEPGEEMPPDLVPCTCQAGFDHYQRIVSRAVGRSGMDHYRHVNFERCPAHPGQEQYWEWGHRWTKNPSGWVWMYGAFYLGKSTLAFCMANAMLDRGLPVMHRVAPTMLNELRQTFADDEAQTFRDQWDSILNIPYLFLDDLDKIQRTPWALERVVELTIHRIDRHLCTVLTSNIEPDQLTNDRDAEMRRLASRLTDQAALIPFTNPPVITGQGKVVV